ncbi:hypothetical protein M8J77_015503 [Diaphorina citri]|nr:hypothetical protein M8J77_015503 [Diaphorina citri]
MVNSKMESWEGRIHLFETIVKVTLLYSGEVWTLRYSEEIERCQVQFFKTILLLKYNTPNHYIRLETGRLSLAHSVLKMSLKWLIKTQELPEYRLPKLCYQKLKLMDETYPNGDVRYNWCTQLKHLMREMGEENINLENVKQNVDEILARAGEKIFQVDRERLRASTYNENYKKIKSVNTLERENYLAYRVPIERTRVICQLRTLGTTICVFLNGRIMRWAVHVARADEESIVKKVFNLDYGTTEKRRRGRPRKRWRDNIKDWFTSIKSQQEEGEKWTQTAQDRPRWRRLIRAGFGPSRPV